MSRSGEKHASLEAKQFQKMTRFVVFTAAARGRECSSSFVGCQELLVVHICISHVLHVSINANLVLIYSEINTTEFGAPLMLLRHTQDEKKKLISTNIEKESLPSLWVKTGKRLSTEHSNYVFKVLAMIQLPFSENFIS